jgi:hypothetical protein
MRYIFVAKTKRLRPLSTAATTGLLHQTQMIDGGHCGTIGGVNIGMGKRSTSAPAPLCPPQMRIVKLRIQKK